MSMIRNNDTASILLVDDDVQIRNELVKTLEKRGFRVLTAGNAQEARASLVDRKVDLIVLDIMMPGESGLDLCRDLRDQSAIPIILLTALGEESDRIVGLEFGADDYIVKPFSAPELIARIRAALRRSALSVRSDTPVTGMEQGFSFEGWQLKTQCRELLDPDGVLVDLTSAEFDLLTVFLERAGRVLSREVLMDLTRGREYEAFDRSVDVLVSRLRTKLRDSGRSAKMLKTVHAAGYVFSAQVAKLMQDRNNVA